MRRFTLLLAATCILVTQGGAEPAGEGPWSLAEISKSDSHRHAKPETGDAAGPLKYLHLGVKFDPTNPDHKLHKFRVVDNKGKTVGDMFGADPKRSLLVFERETPWASLNGLYLEGQGRRIPLFATEPVRPVPTTVVQPTPVPQRTVVEQPPVVVPPRMDNVVTVPATPTYVPRTETVVVEEPRDQVVIHRDRVIHDGPDVVVHDDPDVVVHRDGETTRHVVHHHTGGSGSGGGGGGHGHGHGHGGGGGDGHGSGGGCPYGDACPICGTGADDSALDPWAFDEMGQGRYDDLLARIENSGASLNLGSARAAGGSGTGAGTGSGSGRASRAAAGTGVGPAGAARMGTGAGAGAGAGMGIGQGGGPLPGMASTGNGPGRSPGLPGMGPGSTPGQGTADGTGSGPGTGTGQGTGQGPGAGPGAGPGTGPGTGPGQGPGQGPGTGPGEGQGPGPGEGQGPGPEDSYGPGPEERLANPGQGAPGQGPGAPGPGPMAGPVEAAPGEMMPTEPIPPQDQMAMNNPMNPMMNAPGGPGGGGGGGGVGPTNLIGPDYVNMAGPRVRFHNLAPEVDLPEVDRPVIDMYGYRPTVPYFDPRVRFDPRISQLGYGYGYGRGGGGGGGYGAGGGAYAGLEKTGFPEMPELPEMMPEIVLYISAGNDGEEGGKIYQVNDTGRVLGIINLPYQATGLALHRNDGLIAVTPRDKGKIYRVDDKGTLSVIMEGNPKLPHPVDVGVAGDSDTVVVADSMADVLALTTIAGDAPTIYKRFESSRYDQENMSVAVTRDKHVMYGTDSQNGIYRFNKGKEVKETESLGPVLPGSGGVAADPKSLKWAATQSPNLIHVYEGGMPLKTFKLAPGKSIYRQGLLSFAPSGAVVVASRHSDEVDKEVWLTAYETAEGKEGQILSLFPWEYERMLDFVVGPRMIWEGHAPSPVKSLF